MSGLEACLVNRSSNHTPAVCVSSHSLVVLTDSVRYTFLTIFIIVSIGSIVGNVCTIYAITKRKYRSLQKTCIISLAISDLFSTLLIGTNNIETCSHPLLEWNLGEFLCSFIPIGQIAGIMASSTALMIIAMDRYRNVVHALGKKWNPGPRHCLAIALALWALIFALSSPMANFFSHKPIRIVYYDETSKTFSLVPASLCVSMNKEKMMVYYIAMCVIIFLPVLCVFIWFYYKIAALIWKHRKPVAKRTNGNVEVELTTNSKTASTTGRYEIRPIAARDVRVERKIRSFKIVIALMSVFILCRLPYFAMYITKLSIPNTAGFGIAIWIVDYTFTLMQIVNCALNPLLYTFLNPTLTTLYKLKRFVGDLTWEIVCCLCSRTEFDEFEKENPFVVGEYGKQGDKVAKEPKCDTYRHGF